MKTLTQCPKGYVQDQDKTCSPEETVIRVTQRLEQLSLRVLQESKRIDTGRLGIPVFISTCGADAKEVMPTRKQMGKGASQAQAEASAIMELMERYGFFSYFERQNEVKRLTWDEAEAQYPDQLIPLEHIAHACHDSLPDSAIRELMNLRRWLFVPALRLPQQKTVYVPVELFRQLGEFNGSSAGNTPAESILQGTCELIERHVSALTDRHKPELPTIDANSTRLDPVLSGLMDAFEKNGIRLILKDMSMGMPAPTVGALAVDPSTFPDLSEIVFTAGTATSPTKAAIRAITEVAQLAGDFCTHACYEASGLPKYNTWEETNWLRQGPLCSLLSLPTLEQEDILEELLYLAKSLEDQGFPLYTIDTTNPDTQVSSNYSFAPGLHFRERDPNASLGLFLGRILAEQEDEATALYGLQVLEEHYPQGHFIPFFYGLLAMRTDNLEAARHFFAKALPLQPESQAVALTAFYLGYTHTLEQNWELALPLLSQASGLAPDMKEYRNLTGVCLFKLADYSQAAEHFTFILENLDKGSVMDIQNLGVCYKFLGRVDEAIELLNAALAIDPSLAGARHHLEELMRSA